MTVTTEPASSPTPSIISSKLKIEFGSLDNYTTLDLLRRPGSGTRQHSGEQPGERQGGCTPARLLLSPSLKNVARAAAFMHDERFSTLAQVIEHYNSGVQHGASLDPKLITSGGRSLTRNLRATKNEALVDFMTAISDDTLANDSRFTTPFFH